MKLLQPFRDYISDSINHAPISDGEKTRLRHYSIFLLAGIPTMIVYGILNLLKGEWLMILFVFLSAGGLVTGWMIAKRHGNGQVIYRINAGLYISLLIYSLILGGDGGSKILWMYTFPLISFFLMGKAEGAIWNTAIIALVSTIFFYPFDSPVTFEYPFAFKNRFIVSYFIVTAVTYWLEYFRQHYRGHLEIKNRLLEQEIAQRKQDEQDRIKLVEDLQKALDEVKTLSGFLPICSSCKKIRDDKGYWNKLESYLRAHSYARFSHGICPDCANRLYPDLMAGTDSDKN